MQDIIFYFFGIIILILLVFAETQGKKILGVLASLLLLLLAVIVLTSTLTFQTGTTEEGVCCNGCFNATCADVGSVCRTTQDCCGGLSCVPPSERSPLNTSVCLRGYCSEAGALCNSSASCCSGLFCLGEAGNQTCSIAPPGYHLVTPVYTQPTIPNLPGQFTFSTLIALFLLLVGIFGMLYYGLWVGKELRESG